MTSVFWRQVKIVVAAVSRASRSFLQAVQLCRRRSRDSPCWKIGDAAHAPVGMPIACTAATAASLASAARRAWSRAAPAAVEAANSWPRAAARRLVASSVAEDAAERAFDAASAETAARRASSSDACIAASGPRLAKRRRSQVLISSCGGIVGWDPRRDSSWAGRGCSPCAGRVASCAPCAGLVGRGGTPTSRDPRVGHGPDSKARPDCGEWADALAAMQVLHGGDVPHAWHGPGGGPPPPSPARQRRPRHSGPFNAPWTWHSPSQVQHCSQTIPKLQIPPCSSKPSSSGSPMGSRQRQHTRQGPYVSG